MTKRYSRLAVALLIGITSLVGCGQPPEPATPSDTGSGEDAAHVDPHDIPLTEADIEAIKTDLASYEDALAKIKEHRDAIRDAIAAGDPPTAHRPLDELDIVLEHLATVARENDVPKSAWETVNTSAQQIRELFNKVHAQIDAGKKPDYEAVSGEVDAALGALEGVTSDE